MHKKILLLLWMALSCAFFSCKNNDDDEGDSAPAQQGQILPVEEKVSVSFENNSIYSVNVFVNAHRNLGGEVLVTVPPSKKLNVQMYPSKEKSGYPFYFEYIVPIGSISFPYFSYDNSQVYVVESGKNNEIKISELVSCKEKSTYLVLDNNSDSTVYLLKGGAILTPENADKSLLDSGKDGVYLIGQNSLELYLAESSQYKIRIGANLVSLPEIKFEMGKIYTISVSHTDNNYTTSLKSISPFDIDTQNQIWSLDDSTFYAQDDSYGFEQPLLRSSADPASSAVLMGSLKDNHASVGLISIDKYGKKIINEVGATVSPKEYKISDDKKYDFTPTDITVIDFLEQSDNSIVMLSDNYGTYNDGTADQPVFLQMISCFDLGTKALKWSYVFPDDLRFRNDCKNILIRTQDNKVAFAGGIVKDDGIHRFFCIIDATNVAQSGQITIKKYVSEDVGALTAEGDFESETMFTSCYYDGTDYYVTGFKNCDFKYKSVEHNGIICKFSEDNLQNPVEIYNHKNCLFFCIDGVGGKFWACGEYWLKNNGDILRGCYLSSKMISESENSDFEPVVYAVPGASTHCWFNQLCCYDGKVVLCGKGAQSQDGQTSPLPFVASYGSDDKLQWEATFPNYQNAVSLLPNAIGTYILQLSRSSQNQVHYFSADLLGKEK